MNLNDIYRLMRELRQKMYQTNEQSVTLSQAEFFALYHTICYMMQIKHITDSQG
jgi:hypothetical protein